MKARRPALKSFDDLRQHLQQGPGYLERFVLPDLRFGAFYWIPDEESCLGYKEQHPWVIIAPYRPGHPLVRGCPRTSSQTEARRPADLPMPAGVLEDLERDGVILLDRARVFQVTRFAAFRYIGTLPTEWQERLRLALAAIGERVARESEAP